MTKRLITIVGANGVGKTTTSNALLQMRTHSAYVDADWCRAINPFQFTEKTKETVTENIFCLFRNYLLCDDIETVIFPYGFHGERKSIYVENFLQNQSCNIPEFDNDLVRRLVSSIKVVSAEKLIIQFQSGIVMEQEIRKD